MDARKPAVAGQFYPREAGRLRETAEQYLEASNVAPAPDRVVAVVAPHAGYVYSGPTAGYAYARIKGKSCNRVILLGCSHRYFIETASVFCQGAFDTPLGTFPIDEAFATELAGKLDSKTSEPHMLEHSLEVQLPFISVAIGTVPIVPVLFGGQPGDWHVGVGEALAELADDTDLVIASTDLSHYLSEEEANAVDRRSLDDVLAQDVGRFAKDIGSGASSMCGAAAVAAAMTLAKARGATEWNLLDYRTSAHASGDYDRVVGYGAVTMERPE
ncbi:MAG: AmmeMemoRadiSam system protein B [bacterium]|nr:AmmeMemoRadiSam system protein B [bacterium]